MEDKKGAIFGYQPLWGNWYVDFHIGSGSYGSVYKISRQDMGQTYNEAVKIITIPTEEQYREAESSMGDDEQTLTSYFEDAVRNIVKEINALHSLSGNTNIIGYHDHSIFRKENEIGWDILIRMEYVTSLSKYLKDHRLTREEVVRLGIDICTALELCSRKGIIHRDIKDDNIFINENGAFKLGDFGIARELSKSGRAASMRGTPKYMAPEVARGDKYDISVDIYSLGLVLYRLVNDGRMPFMPPYPQKIIFGDSDTALDKRLQGEPLTMPSKAGGQLGQVILRACAYKPEDRYLSASAMKHDLEAALAAMGAGERESR